MTHSEHSKIFDAISKHLEMEEERIKIYASPSVAFVDKGSGPRGRKPYRGKKPKKGPHPPQTLASMVTLPTSIRLRAMELRIWNV